MGSPIGSCTHLNDFELASRLSYFLWSSMPDEQLFAAARKSELRSTEKLAQEFDRMIADPKIIESTNADEHRLQSLIRRLVLSELFSQR